MDIHSTHYDAEAQRVVIIARDGSIHYRSLTGGGWTDLSGPAGPETPTLRPGTTRPAFQRDTYADPSETGAECTWCGQPRRRHIGASLLCPATPSGR